MALASQMFALNNAKALAMSLSEQSDASGLLESIGQEAKSRCDIRQPRVIDYQRWTLFGMWKFGLESRVKTSLMAQPRTSPVWVIHYCWVLEVSLRRSFPYRECGLKGETLGNLQVRRDTTTTSIAV